MQDIDADGLSTTQLGELSLCPCVFEDEHVLIVNKAPGVDFHRHEDEPSLIDRVRAQHPATTLLTVHRLDKVTSGLVVFAKHPEVASELGRRFEAGEIEKFYLALANRPPRKKQGLIKGDMIKARGGAWRLSTTYEHPAITQFFSYSLQPGLRLFLLRPRTGRTHQLRVAMKALGAPILGDALYGGECAGVDRTYLHAFCLRFALLGKAYQIVCWPDQGRLFQVTPLDELASLHEPWLLPWPQC
ncbi:tRNA pseudouridine32 synthase/23S rRNA pseudouridine746 synthase [Chitinivorax tropicus]|uniref:tRNA pseudouridine32 synthase/23S rRNA pseudouridine746 synthase n=1 Tax=Chitinivorax tropicus TaxID=714531 RepID=A0A840MQU1_9PROT|nr:tRNA pseudouridine32 synthase/23S rRNA pseudouridine746 synthase [Chitinivorax tropicus]